MDNIFVISLVFTSLKIPTKYYTGFKMVFSKDEQEKLSDTKIFKFVKRTFKMTRKLYDEHFIIRKNKKILITPLLFALIIIEFMDIIFAIDSIPAIFLITQDVFIVYTSNIFAILGLRALYFLLAASINRFTYLKPALAVILIFIGSKIFLPHIGINLEPIHSLIITFGILIGSVILSITKPTKIN